MVEVPRKSFNNSGWWLQYGRWDLRLDCPICQQWEAFFGTIADVADDGLMEKPGCCKQCGFMGPLVLSGFTQEVLDSVDRRELSLLWLGREDQTLVLERDGYATNKALDQRVLPDAYLIVNTGAGNAKL